MKAFKEEKNCSTKKKKKKKKREGKAEILALISNEQRLTIYCPIENIGMKSIVDHSSSNPCSMTHEFLLELRYERALLFPATML